MINSILHFQENGTKRLTKVFEDYGKDFSRLAGMVYGVTEEVTKLGCSMIAEEWESYDEILRERKDLRKDWHIVRKDETMVTTSLGDITYSRTLFKNKKTGNRWSRTGCDKMAHLRVYQKNGGNMLELVRYQKEELPLAAGAEEVIYSATEMITMENRNKNRLGALADIPVYSIPYLQIKKIAALKNHIWGL